MSDDYLTASCHVVSDVACPGQRVTWLSRLRGLLVFSVDGCWTKPLIFNSMCLSFLICHVTRYVSDICGASEKLRHAPAGHIRTPRHVLLAPSFVAAHPGLAKIVQTSLRGGWRVQAGTG